MDFLVVEFVEEQEVDVVSKKWMLGQNACYWPPIRSSSKIAKAVQEHQTPEKSWPSFPVRILYSADTYQKAREKLSAAEETSDIQSAAESTPKRRRIANHRYVSDSSDEEVSPRREKDTPANPPSRASPNKTSESCGLRKDQKKKKTTLPDVPSPPPLRASTVPSPSILEPRTTVASGPSAATPLPVTAPVHSVPATVSPAERQMFVLLETMKAKQEELISEVKINQEKIVAVVEALSDRGDMNSASVTEVLNLPITCLEDMEALDQKLKQDSDVAKRLTLHLSLIGGRKQDDFVRRIMAACLTNSLAKEYNWCGRFAKQPFSGLHLNTVIFNAVTKNPHFRKITKSEVEEIQKAWLRFAKDREGGRSSRKLMSAVNN